MHRRILIALLLTSGAAPGEELAPPLLSVDFDAALNPDAERITDHPLIALAPGQGVGGGNAIRVSYVGFHRGSKRVALRIPLPDRGDEMSLCYDVKFPGGFDFARGGKLHGLGPDRPVTGGRPLHDEGWSARATFRAAGGLSAYLYQQDQPGRYGSGPVAKDFRFERDRFHAVSIHLRLNDPPAAANGTTELFVDGESVARVEGLRFRAAAGPASEISHFLFNTFHGGDGEAWAPRDADGTTTTVHALFDNFVVHRGRHVRRAPGSEDLVFIDDGTLRAGFQLSSGGALAWLSPSGDKRNWLDRHDRGRLVQQSFYGDDDGTRWAEKPWHYNPVQGGDYRGRSSLLQRARRTATGFSSSCIPRHWAGGGLLEECAMEQAYQLDGDGLLSARYRFVYRGARRHAARDQELPALFADRRLDILVTPDGGGFAETRPGFPNEYIDLPRQWAGWFGADGRGLGICVPGTTRATCYRFRDDGVSDCSYIAPLRRFALEPGLEFEYRAHFRIGTRGDLRTAFEGLTAGNPSPTVPR